MAFSAFSGQTYYLAVGAYPWAQPGQLIFHLNATLPLDIGISVNPTGWTEGF